MVSYRCLSQAETWRLGGTHAAHAQDYPNVTLALVTTYSSKLVPAIPVVSSGLGSHLPILVQ